MKVWNCETRGKGVGRGPWQWFLTHDILRQRDQRLSQSTGRKDDLQNQGKHPQAVLLVEDEFPNYLKSSYNSIGKCRVSQFETQKWYSSRHFPSLNRWMAKSVSNDPRHQVRTVQVKSVVTVTSQLQRQRNFNSWTRWGSKLQPPLKVTWGDSFKKLKFRFLWATWQPSSAYIVK